MKITQDVRDYAASQGIEEIPVAIEKGLQDKAREFREAEAKAHQET